MSFQIPVQRRELENLPTERGILFYNRVRSCTSLQRCFSQVRMMSYRILSPLSGTQRSNARPPFGGGLATPLTSWEARLFRSWFVYDPNADRLEEEQPRRLNWNRLGGFALAAGLSAAGWLGVVMLLRYLLS